MRAHTHTCRRMLPGLLVVRGSTAARPRGRKELCFSAAFLMSDTTGSFAHAPWQPAVARERCWCPPPQPDIAAGCLYLLARRTTACKQRRGPASPGCSRVGKEHSSRNDRPLPRWELGSGCMLLVPGVSPDSPPSAQSVLLLVMLSVKVAGVRCTEDLSAWRACGLHAVCGCVAPAQLKCRLLAPTHVTKSAMLPPCCGIDYFSASAIDFSL